MALLNSPTGFVPSIWASSSTISSSLCGSSACSAVRDSSESALCAYTRRVTRKEHPKFLDLHQASDMIEQLKKWLDRTRTAPFRAMLPHINPKTSARAIYSIVQRALKMSILDCDVTQWQHAQTLFKDVVAQATETTGGHDG